MKVLTYTKGAYDLSQLHDALVAALPNLFVQVLPDGTRMAVSTVEAAGTEIRLTVPDDAHEPILDSIVSAHTPQPVPVPPDPLVNLDDAFAAVDVTNETPAVKQMHAAVRAFVAASRPPPTP